MGVGLERHYVSCVFSTKEAHTNLETGKKNTNGVVLGMTTKLLLNQ